MPSAVKSQRGRGRPPDPRLTALDQHLIDIVAEHEPITVRGVFYRAEVQGLVEKNESAVRQIGRRLLNLRRKGRIPYMAIVDESRDVYYYASYDGPHELADRVAELYRRDYWRHAEEWVQIWIEKRALAGVIQPVVADHWGLNLYVCGGQPSESYLFQAGRHIANQGVPTVAYILSDFDPAGGTIFTTLATGTKGCPGGLSRFTDGVPVRVERLALTREQIDRWNLPTRPAKRSDTRSAKFIARHGDLSVELDAITPTDLRQLVDGAIARHMDPDVLAAYKSIEELEREILRRALSGDTFEAR